MPWYRIVSVNERLSLPTKSGTTPANVPKAYQPITLLPVMGKLYERLILKRVTARCEECRLPAEN